MLCGTSASPARAGPGVARGRPPVPPQGRARATTIAAAAAARRRRARRWAARLSCRARLALDARSVQTTCTARSPRPALSARPPQTRSDRREPGTRGPETPGRCAGSAGRVRRSCLSRHLMPRRSTVRRAVPANPAREGTQEGSSSKRHEHAFAITSSEHEQVFVSRAISPLGSPLTMSHTSFETAPALVPMPALSQVGVSPEPRLCPSTDGPRRTVTNRCLPSVVDPDTMGELVFGPGLLGAPFGAALENGIWAPETCSCETTPRATTAPSRGRKRPKRRSPWQKR
jgi:hypothetical protein